MTVQNDIDLLIDGYDRTIPAMYDEMRQEGLAPASEGGSRRLMRSASQL